MDCSWNVTAHGDARGGEWRGNWRMEWVASTLHTTSEHGVSSITTADAHTSAASSWLNWRPRRFKGPRPFRWKTIAGFCVCAFTFHLASTTEHFYDSVPDRTKGLFSSPERQTSCGTTEPSSHWMPGAPIPGNIAARAWSSLLIYLYSRFYERVELYRHSLMPSCRAEGRSNPLTSLFCVA